MSVKEISEFIEGGKSFEVQFNEKGLIIQPYKGIAKTDAKDVKKLAKKSKVKISKGLKDLLLQISNELISKKITFRLIFEKEPLLKFDLDHYLKFEDNTVKIFGFKNEEESPLSLIIQSIKPNYTVKFYKQLS
jgi:hypothetical protein